VNQDGDTLTKEERLFGKLGEVYKTTAKLIPGYVLVATPMNQSGVFTEDTIEVVYVYEKAVTILPDEQTPTDTIDKGKPLDLQKPVNNNSQGAISYIPVKKYSALPKTNSESDIELTLIGLFIVSGLGILFINQRKQKR
jgi:LPXTG-motif cell wall-anchored protein